MNSRYIIDIHVCAYHFPCYNNYPYRYANRVLAKSVSKILLINRTIDNCGSFAHRAYRPYDPILKNRPLF